MLGKGILLRYNLEGVAYVALILIYNYAAHFFKSLSNDNFITCILIHLFQDYRKSTDVCYFIVYAVRPTWLGEYMLYKVAQLSAYICEIIQFVNWAAYLSHL